MLPTGIGMCKGLHTLVYDGNPLDKMPLELLSAPRAVLDYLKRLFKAGPPPAAVARPGAWEGKSRCLNLDDLGLQAPRPTPHAPRRAPTPRAPRRLSAADGPAAPLTRRARACRRFRRTCTG